VAAKPELDHTRYHSLDELRQHALQHLRDAVSLLEQKATPREVDDYRQFIITLANKVANAHREHGQQVSDAERKAIEDISSNLGVQSE
jgi:predicted outer membrane protein